MIVYAETNFILELTLGQEQCESCRQLLEWAREQRLRLQLPAYALYESRSALRLKERDRKVLRIAIEKQVLEFGRTLPFRTLTDAFEAARAALNDASTTEILLYERVIGDLDTCASYLPFDHDAARNVEIFRKLLLLTGEADLMIFASVVADLQKRTTAGDTTPSIFVTRNSRDFRREARTFLRQFSCDLFTSYDSAVARLRTTLP